jgi:hypothetical protein
MHSVSVVRIEKSVDRAAAAFFAVACGYAAYAWLAAVAGPFLQATTVAAGVIAYPLCLRALGGVQPRARRLPVPVFDVREIESCEPGELLLTEQYEPEELLLTERYPADELLLTDRYMADELLLTQRYDPLEPLVLDDIVDQLSPDSRVVRLFDPASMPTPAQLKSRIDEHLDGAAPEPPAPDAAQALHEALAELRRSIR